MKQRFDPDQLQWILLRGRHSARRQQARQGYNDESVFQGNSRMTAVIEFYACLTNLHQFTLPHA
ncbi:hypothetical protein LP419_16225 [Massilia sp. H-1]|nr:hypothetical protein LP419_16225 [Massilia sp. H-1]